MISSKISGHGHYHLIPVFTFMQKVEKTISEAWQITHKIKVLVNSFFSKKELDLCEWYFAENSKESALEVESTLNSDDLVYGFTENREAFFKLNYPQKISSWNIYTVDLPNDVLFFIYSKINMEKLISAKSLLTEVTNIVEKSIETLPCEKEHKEKIFRFHNFCFLLEPKLLKDQSIFVQHLQGRLQSKMQNSYVKKRCKIGILWALHEKNSIHFILDRKEKAFNESNPFSPIKTDFNKCFSKRFHTYTFSELRFIYRLWPHLNVESKKRIKFYQSTLIDYKEVSAPWVSNPHFHTIYVPKNRKISFYKSALPSLFNS